MNDRYSRQILFAPIGMEGQEKIKSKHVLIVGAGALGSANAEMLARAGVGKLTIVDRDYVEWSNLQRQQLYCEEDVIQRLPKAIAAKKRLLQIRSDIEIEAIVMDASAPEIERWVSEADLIVDGTDHFEIRMMINDAAQKYKKPWIFGACLGSYAMSLPILPGETPCLHCLLETLPFGGGSCDTAGIIAPAVQMVVALQGAEVLKILVEDWKAVRRKLVTFDLWNNQFASIDVQSMKKSDCPSCGKHPTYPFLSYEVLTKSEVLCGRNTVQIRPPKPLEIDLTVLEERLLRQGISFEKNPYLLSFSVENCRLVIFRDGRALIHGTDEIAKAKSLYYRYLG
jgi:sulfur carrier protein ThiS adenylyltransferase